MKIPGADWVHPWARAARAAEVIRLSEPVQAALAPKPEWEQLAEEIEQAARAREALRQLHAGMLDALKGPRDPDPLVFGPYRENLSDPNWEKNWCTPCGVGWSIYQGNACWNCGGELPDD